MPSDGAGSGTAERFEALALNPLPPSFPAPPPSPTQQARRALSQRLLVAMAAAAAAATAPACGAAGASQLPQDGVCICWGNRHVRPAGGGAAAGPRPPWPWAPAVSPPPRTVALPPVCTRATIPPPAPAPHAARRAPPSAISLAALPTARPSRKPATTKRKALGAAAVAADAHGGRVEAAHPRCLRRPQPLWWPPSPFAAATCGTNPTRATALALAALAAPQRSATRRRVGRGGGAGGGGGAHFSRRLPLRATLPPVSCQFWVGWRTMCTPAACPPAV